MLSVGDGRAVRLAADQRVLSGSGSPVGGEESVVLGHAQRLLFVFPSDRFLFQLAPVNKHGLLVKVTNDGAVRREDVRSKNRGALISS